jgi:undecaprenyl diphosphate synthase
LEIDTLIEKRTAVPRHIAFIMDGNGRWAQRRGMPRSAEHKAGFEHIPDVLEACHVARELVTENMPCR